MPETNITGNTDSQSKTENLGEPHIVGPILISYPTANEENRDNPTIGDLPERSNIATSNEVNFETQNNL